MLAARRPDAPPAAVTLRCRSWPRLFRGICRRQAFVVQPLEPACAAARGPLGQARAPPAVAARRRRRWPRRSPAAARPRLRGGSGAVRALLQRRRSNMETARLTSRIALPASRIPPCSHLGSDLMLFAVGFEARLRRSRQCPAPSLRPYLRPSM